MNKRGAIELSVGTIVIIVLAMSMLILGLVLVKNIFSGSTENIDTINDAVKDQISKAFNRDDVKVVVNLANKIAKIKQGESWGVAFGVKNLVGKESSFEYKVVASDLDIVSKCGISKVDAESWIITGRASSFTLASGGDYYGIIRFQIPETAPLCTIRFDVVVTMDGKAYDTQLFDVQVRP